MKPYGYIAVSAALFCALLSCAGYRTVTFERKLASALRLPAHGVGPSAEEGSDGTGAKKPPARVTTVRRLALMGPPSPVAAINDAAVGLAEAGRLGEAEILLREALAEEPRSAAVRNNLGVICEIAGKRNEAFDFYTAACLAEPANAVYRRNFIGFADSDAGRK